MLSNIKFDADKIENGVWVSLLNSEFLIASVENSKFKHTVFESRFVAISDEFYCKILADTILLDWRNVKDPNGDDLPYSKALAEIALKSNFEVRALVDSVSTTLKYFAD